MACRLRRRQRCRAGGVDTPASIRVLVVENMTRRFLETLGRTRAEKGVQQDVVGFEGGVGFELALPVAWFCLKRKQVIGAALDGLFQARRPILLVQRHGRRRDGNFFSHSNRRGHERSPRAQLRTSEMSKAV